MARQARTISPTDYYHVIMRGNNRTSIFSNHSQKQYFRDLLKEQKEECLLEIAGYCIMDNHVHIAVKADLDNLTKSMKSVNIRYAMRYNREKEQIGHVYQDRYKSEVIHNENILSLVIRYIHNNPVKAKIVNHPGDYKWSSYNEYFNNSNDNLIDISQREFVLELNNGISNFKEFHKLEDQNEYLEINEDRDKNRIDKAMKILGKYIDIEDRNSINNLKQDIKLQDEIIKNLLENSNLSHRKIAEILDVTSSKVHYISSKK